MFLLDIAVITKSATTAPNNVWIGVKLGIWGSGLGARECVLTLPNY